ncbi:6274_t:CDS:2 [Scutellospora calospora]|uniref:6274_t:CDS:1 n=1 Tax=Scutellospora calospora TaxID=85575 RepID=A0ACA9K1M2_9GLOM|nr:6274_t:CDS:2 [Scutellospora calospora]
MSSTNTSSSIDYKTLFEQEKKLKEEALEKLERVNTTAILIINKLQHENVKLKDEKSVDSLDDDYDNYLLDREKCNNFIYHKDNCN